jgi:hypothetical protein
VSSSRQQRHDQTVTVVRDDGAWIRRQHHRRGRTIANPLTIADFRQIAQRRLPKFVFDYVDGAAGDETTMHRNEAALG